MKLLSASFLLLPLLTLAAKSSSNKAATFEKYHAKARSSSPVQLTDTAYGELTSLPRNHSVVLCFTALGSQYGCKMCQEFKPEWELLAKSWAKGDAKGESRTIFGTLDFADGRQTFQSLGLETAPVVMYFPPTTGPHAKSAASPARYDFTTGAPTAEQLHSWIARHSPAELPKPSVKRPMNYLLIITVTVFTLGGLTALTLAWPYVQFIVQNRNLWAAASVIAILLFTSGHMYNHIRGTPYVTPDGKGGVTYFASGFQNQLGLESQIVAGIYGVLAFATLALAVRVPRMKNPQSQQAAVFIWSAVMYLVYSFLLRVFRTKNQGYPYGLPPF